VFYVRSTFQRVRHGIACCVAKPLLTRYRVADVHRQRPGLVAAQCKAGIVGSFPALNARPAELLDTWLTELQAELAAFQAANPDKKVGPIAVNQIVHQSNDRLAHDVEVCVKHQIPIIISSLRAPPKKCSTPSTAMAASCCMT
jgi:NAD(P)H-dependent flavin oxidoreductase YrpB (nitropropane dioxygenase family)